VIGLLVELLLLLLAYATAWGQPPSPQAGGTLTLRLIQPNLTNLEAQPKIAVTALSGIYLSHTDYRLEGHTSPEPLPQGSAMLAVNARVTNLSKDPVNLRALGSLAGAGFGGEFDVPKGAYEQVFGQRETLARSTPWLPPGPPFSCGLSDQSVHGDCEVAFEAYFVGSEESLAPGASGEVILESSFPDARFSTIVPEGFDTSGVRVFIRDPRDQANYPTHFLMACSDPTRPPTEVSSLGLLMGWVIDTHAYEEGTHESISSSPGEAAGCELPLTLELRLLGETAPPVALGEDGPGSGDCRISSLDSESNSAVSIGVLTTGSKSDVEESLRSDHHWYVSARGESGAGLTGSIGIRAGPLKADVEASGRFTYGGESELRFAAADAGRREAEEVVRYINGKLSGNPSAEAAARVLALHDLGATYLDSGVDLEGSVGGTPGQLQVGISTPQGVVRYSNGDRGIYSTLSANGAFTGPGASGALALGGSGEALESTEVDFTNEDEPTFLTVRTDAGASVGLSPPQLKGSAEKVFGQLKNAEASASASSGAGLDFSLQDEAELGHPRNPEVKKSAQELLDALEVSSEQLPPNISSIAQQVSADSAEYLVLSQQGAARARTSVGFSLGLSFGLDFGTAVTTEQVLYASKRPPGGAFTTWTDCVPGP
jgi:hypothetical protein